MLVPDPEFGKLGLSERVGGLCVSGLAAQLEEGIVEVFLGNVETLLFPVDPGPLDVGVVLRVGEVSVGLAYKEGADLDALGLVALSCGDLSLVPPLSLILGVELGVDGLGGALFIAVEAVLVGGEPEEFLVVIVVRLQGGVEVRDVHWGLPVHKLLVGVGVRDHLLVGDALGEHRLVAALGFRHRASPLFEGSKIAVSVVVVHKLLPIGFFTERSVLSLGG